MALMTGVNPAMIAVALGVSAPEAGSTTEQQWFMWIDDALMLIDSRATELEISEVPQAKLDYVVREAVVAHARRPDSATQVTVSVDDGSTTKAYRSSAGRLAILDEWWSMLGLAPSGGGAFNVDTVSSSTVHRDICALNLGAVYCSCGADIAGYPIYEGDGWSW